MRRGEPLSGARAANVQPGSIIFTDDWIAYKPLAASPGPPRHQSLRGRLRQRRHPHEHDRGLLRQPQDRDARHLQAGLPASGSSPTWTSTRGAITNARGRALDVPPLLDKAADDERAERRIRSIRRAANAARQGGSAAPRGDRRARGYCQQAQSRRSLDHPDCFSGRSFSSGRLRPTRPPVTRSIRLITSSRLGTRISSPFGVRCFGPCFSPCGEVSA